MVQRVSVIKVTLYSVVQQKYYQHVDAHFDTVVLRYPFSLQGPFSTFHVRQDYAGCEWTGLKFSNDGKRILILTNIGQLKLVDAFQGHELNTLSVCFVPNSRRAK